MDIVAQALVDGAKYGGLGGLKTPTLQALREIPMVESILANGAFEASPLNHPLWTGLQKEASEKDPEDDE